MAPIKTKDHLVYFMQCGMLRLSRYDLHFIQNLHNLIITKGNVTTNQVALFEKVVEKYSRQLSKHGLIKSKIDQLNWETVIVPSDKKFTEAYISIVEDKIIFKSPFNKKFLESFNRDTYNSFKWIREDKHYISDFSAEALKHLLRRAKEHYSVINYCPITSTLINNVEQFNAKYWEPTLIHLHGKYIIASINEPLNDAVKDIELSNDPECLSMLATYGIKIDDSIINGDPLLKFASEYFTEIDYTNTDIFIKYLHAIKCDCIFTAGLTLPPQYKKILISKIKESNIEVEEKSNILLTERLRGKKNPVVMFMLQRNMSNIPAFFKKIVKITNGLPILIK